MPREQGGRKSLVWRMMLGPCSTPKITSKVVQVRSSSPSNLKNLVGQVVSSCSSRWSRLVSSSWSSRGGNLALGYLPKVPRTSWSLRRPQEAPRAPRDGPRSRQERSKSCPETVSGRSWATWRRPAAPEPPRGLVPGSTFDRFGALSPACQNHQLSLQRGVILP